MSQAAPRHAAEGTADVIVVGAGPAGSATAAHLAQAGLDVLVLEKATFPHDTDRGNNRGEALSPRAVRELITLGVPTDGWVRTKGVRIIGGGMRLQVAWPDEAAFPPYGFVRSRRELDQALAEHAAAKGARVLHGVEVTGPIKDSNGRIVGVEARRIDDEGAKVGFDTPLVIAADGAGSVLAQVADHESEQPEMYAVCATYSSPRSNDDHLESWVEFPTPDGGEPMRGRGWIHGLGDGTSTVGLTVREDISPADAANALKRWVATMPSEWTFDDSTMQGEIEGTRLPAGLTRGPLYADGLLLVGDAGACTNPFTGEGIAAALESGRLAAQVVVQAFARCDAAGREQVLASYPDAVSGALGGYYTMGRWFAKMIGNPHLERWAVKYAVPRATTMRFAVKLMANLGDTHGRNADDRLLAALTRVTPAA